jgi:uncharacterized protein
MNKPSPLLPFALVAASLAVGCGGSAPTAAPVASPSSAASASTSPAAAAPADGLDALSDDQLVHKLLEVTGASNLGMQVANGMMDSFRKMPNLPPQFMDRFKQNLHPETLVALVVPIYLKHYDHATLIAAIRFYQSDPGQKMVKALPAVTKESMEAGKAWGSDLARKTLTDVGAAAP